MTRPIVVLGAGVLGRRIAAVLIAGGHTVHVRDPSTQALNDAASFINAHLHEFTAITPTPHPVPGTYKTFVEISSAVAGAWLVIEAVPEKLPLKIDTFAEVDRHAPADCIIASNSSSFKSSLMVERVSEQRKQRVLNIHFTMPPQIRTVELMTNGQTKSELFVTLSEILKGCGMVPVTARKESTG
jgi:3-hydroxyacyl-CoA dehydrogenase